MYKNIRHTLSLPASTSALLIQTKKKWVFLFGRAKKFLPKFTQNEVENTCFPAKIAKFAAHP